MKVIFSPTIIVITTNVSLQGLVCNMSFSACLPECIDLYVWVCVYLLIYFFKIKIFLEMLVYYFPRATITKSYKWSPLKQWKE
jgi:hypothetical protein